MSKLPFFTIKTFCNYSIYYTPHSQPSISRSDCTKCGERRSAFKEVDHANEALKAKLRVHAAVLRWKTCIFKKH